jgi:FMN phosphatase YigB (HAD superfamily)
VSRASEIRTIFWDIGGVLLTNGWDVNQRARVLTALGVDLSAYEAIQDAVNYYWERGLINAREFFEQTVLETNPQLNLTFEQLWQLVCDESKVLHQECFDILAALKRAGQHRLATLNNESRELNEHRLTAFNLRQFFDYFICSGYVHEMKPLPDIFRAATDISGFVPATALFIDDKQENCDAARALGMQAIHFESPVQLRASLTQLGIAV